VSPNWRSLFRGSRGAVLILGTLLAQVALAQVGQTTLLGNVVDASTKKPVADVVVTATSPQLQGEQVVVTDPSGNYRISQLNAGTYTLRFEKESYRPYSRTGIDLRTEQTIRLNVELLPETAGAEEIVVVGKPPTVDVGSTTTGATVTAEFATAIPVARNARTFEALAQIAPGVQTDFQGTAIAGATSPENSFLVDGLSTNNTAYGLNGSPITIEFIDQVNIITGGFMPEYGRTTGGAISAFTKSGGNEFHGSVWGTWTPGSLLGPTPVIVTTGATFSNSTQLYNRWDVGATLGGYIIKDKLWFFAGFSPSQVKNQQSRTTNVVNGTATDPAGPVPGSVVNTYSNQTNYQYIGKLTFLLNPDNTFTFAAIGQQSPSVSFPSLGSDLKTTGPTATDADISTSFLDLNLAYKGAFLEKRLLLDITLGYHHETGIELPTDGSQIDVVQSQQTGAAGVNAFAQRSGGIGTLTPAQFGRPIPTQCLPSTVQPGNAPNPCPINAAQTYNVGPYYQLFNQTIQNTQGKAVLTWLARGLGSHVVKAGFDIANQQYDNLHGYPGSSGGFLLRGTTGAGTAYLVYRGFGTLEGPDQINPFNVNSTTRTLSVGGFIQDSWSIMDKVTLNIGLRYDDQTIYASNGSIGLALPNQWSPRIGVIWDPTYQGRSKIFANFGIYYENLPLDISARSFFPGEQSVSSNRNVLRTQPLGVGCNPLSDPNYAKNCFNAANGRPSIYLSSNAVWQVNSGDGTTWPDPNIQPQSSNEFVVGGEYEIFANARLGASYTRRWLNKIIEDMSNDNANTYFLGNPGYGIASNFPKAVRNYTAITVYFTKNFADLWQAQVSYTYQSLTGNDEGLIASNYGQLDPNITANFDLRRLLANASGPLPGDITNTIKVFGSKEFVILPVFSITLGGAYTGRSGIPVSYTAADPVYGNSVSYVLPRGDAGRLPWINSIDGKLGLNYRISKDVTLNVGLDVFNIFNFEQVQNVDQNYTFEFVLPIQGAGAVPGNAGTPNTLKGTPSSAKNIDGTTYVHAEDNANFGHAACGGQALNQCTAIPAYQPPRSWRFSARVTF
jgi:hypothetical protein